MLKMFVATLCTQGDVPGDFCFVPEGELVGRYSIVCDLEKVDGSGCGCGRAFGGFVTHAGTTTAIVVERDMSELEWRAELFQTLCDTGWGTAMQADKLAELVDDLVEHDLGTAAKLPAGQVIGRRAWNTRGTTMDYLTLRRLNAQSARGAA
ncbi:MAG TPA: hypothetical protein VHN36_11520 [Ilumatobacteraceae bacterium]|nr:hypothetical protein [Ilumatobacteraceae bacterium]